MVALAVTLAAHGLYQYFVELPATRELYKSNPEQALRECMASLRDQVRAVETRTMPLGNRTHMTERERAILARWIERNQKQLTNLDR